MIGAILAAIMTFLVGCGWSANSSMPREKSWEKIEYKGNYSKHTSPDGRRFCLYSYSKAYSTNATWNNAVVIDCAYYDSLEYR